MQLMKKPLLLSITTVVLWLGYRAIVGFVPDIKADEGVIASGTIAILGIFWALIAAFVFATVWSQWIAVEEAVKTLDRETFNKHKDKRIPATIKMLVVVGSILVIGAFFIAVSFKHWVTGAYTIFAMTMILTTYWEIILDLDDPFTGVWNVTIPKEWKG